jgi:enoyl-CoA hydratase
MTPDPVEPVRRAVSDGRMTITLDSPANRNALSASLVAGVLASLDSAAADAGVRFVVLTHAGGTFCAGADLAEAARDGGPAQGTERLVGLLRRMITFPKPIVAVVDGHVRAGGLGLVGAVDVAIAGPACTFALTEARLGLAPAIISLTLADRVEPRAWVRYGLGGETFDAAEAARIGLVTIAADDTTAALAEVASAYDKASPQGLRATKELVNARLVETFDARASALVRRSAELFASEEAQEGIAAFRARRPPRWARG